jgi:hypothetical protein
MFDIEKVAQLVAAPNPAHLHRRTPPPQRPTHQTSLKI